MQGGAGSAAARLLAALPDEPRHVDLRGLLTRMASHRRRGFAAAAAGALITHLRREGREPVWGALDENPASGATARGLGFRPAVAFAVLSPPGGA